jgi:hypothetical protein
MTDMVIASIEASWHLLDELDKETIYNELMAAKKENKINKHNLICWSKIISKCEEENVE